MAGVKATVKLNLLPVQTIMTIRGLQNKGPVQKFFTNEVARKCDPLIPMDTGMLKNNKAIGIDSITYESPYAKRQYYENRGFGNGGTSIGGLRGKLWDKRCKTLYGKQITRSVAKMAGGRAE